MEEKKELLDQDERVVEIELERLRGFVNHPTRCHGHSITWFTTIRLLQRTNDKLSVW